jgi:DNA-directed RNA polymerase subunit RPC12/RpoP
MSVMSTMTKKASYAYPEPGAWKRGDPIKGTYLCASCGREVYYESAMSGSAWRHADTKYVRCDREAKP